MLSPDQIEAVEALERAVNANMTFVNEITLRREHAEALLLILYENAVWTPQSSSRIRNGDQSCK